MSTDPVRDKVAQFISRYHMLPSGARAGVAVSGGADSVCLLHILHDLAREAGWTLEVLHLNHQLRGAESDGDEAFVRTLAQDLGLVCHAERVTLGAGNLENAGREARQAFFRRMRQRANLTAVATAHTQSDQAETVLYRILRGAGLTGLAGILPVTAEGLIRPLLGVDRTSVLEYLTERGLSWREDASNQDLSFARNRLRHHLLPVLQRENSGVDKSLAQLGELARDEESFWSGWVGAWLAHHVRERKGAMVVPLEPLLAETAAAQRRLVRGLFRKVKGDLLGLAFEHVESVLNLARGRDGDGRVILPGVDVMRSMDWLRVCASPNSFGENRFWEMVVTAPGEYRPQPGLPALRLSLADREPLARVEALYNDGIHWLDSNVLATGLILRSWRPGDRYQPAGCTEAIKLKSLFQDARVPLWERRDWPVLCNRDRDEIVWTRRFGVAHASQPGPESGHRLEVVEVE